MQNSLELKINRPFLLKIFIGITCSIFLVTSCSNKPSNELLIGEWRTTKMDISNYTSKPPQALIDNAIAISLAHSITFKKDTTFVETFKKNTIIDFTYRYIGKFEIDKSKEVLTTFVEKFEVEEPDGTWKMVKKNDFNKDVFRPTQYKILELKSNKIKVSTKDGHNETVIYTWAK